MAVRSVVALLLVSSVQPLAAQFLVDGEETELRLLANTDSRFTFQLPLEHYPLWLWITPCGEPVEWRLEYQGPSTDPANLYQTTDHADDSFNQLELSQTTVVFSSHNTASTSGNDLIDAPNKVILAEQMGSQRMKYYSISIPTKFVSLVVRAKKDTVVRVFMTSSLRMVDQVYPRLPADGVKRKLLQSSENSLDAKSQLYSSLVHWTPSESAALFGMALQYCLVVSDDQPIATMCEVNRRNDLRSLNCVNHTVSEYRIGGLRPDRQYHVTLFAVNMATGASAGYESLALKLPYPGQETAPAAHRSHARRRHNAGPLYDARLQAGKLEARRGAAINYDFVVRQHQDDQKVLLVFHACAGYIRVALYRDGKLLRKSDTFTGYRRFLVVNAKPGQLRVRVTNGDKRENVFKVWASVRPNKNPYPQLPDDTSVKETGRTCSSTTLQWLRSSGHARYCLYRRRESVNYLEELVKQDTNQCVGTPPSTELVGCFNDYGNTTADDDRVSALMQTTVEGLDAGVAYRFDLLARPLRRVHSQQLPYRTLWVKTRPFC